MASRVITPTQLADWLALHQQIEQCEQALAFVIDELSQPGMLEAVRREVLGEVQGGNGEVQGNKQGGKRRDGKQRERCEMTQARLGKRLGVGQAMICQYETGLAKLTAKHAMRLLAAISNAQSAIGSGNEQ